MDADREKRIQDAIDAATPRWDKLYRQKDWNNTTKLPSINHKKNKLKRVGGWKASRALKKLY